MAASDISSEQNLPNMAASDVSSEQNLPNMAASDVSSEQNLPNFGCAWRLNLAKLAQHWLHVAFAIQVRNLPVFPLLFVFMHTFQYAE